MSLISDAQIEGAKKAFDKLSSEEQRELIQVLSRGDIISEMMMYDAIGMQHSKGEITWR